MSGPDGALEADALSIPALVAIRRSAADALRFRERARALPGWSTQDLVLRFETTNDPLMVWALNLECERRGLPPVLRWPGQQIGPQGDLLDLAADVRWLQIAHPHHRAKARGWRSVLREAPGTKLWHEQLHRQFLFTYPRGLGWLAAKGLDVSENQRLDLMTMPTASMARERRGLLGAAFSDLQQRLIDHAHRHPDRARLHAPEQVGIRRARLYRVHALTGRSPSRTAALWEVLTGESITRQAVANQIAAAELVLG